ncbi:hypothetical protein C8R44DRAFT_619278 [Mycena epipterygia]|nr:hypothetical protein C8R44DRAFT_619278 [Mycena epipterygia]
MASSSSTLPQPITLHFQNVVRVAGETIEGHVDLNVAQAQEDHIEQLRVKLRGSISTRITTSNGQSTYTHRQTILLVHSNLSLWKQGAAFPDAGSHILACPFRFQLPANLPPSFHCSAHRRSGAVSYSLEVVGDRPGLFRSNRRIRRLISVVPSASESQLLAKESLMQGWSGAWKDIKREEKLRQGIWGDYSHARAVVRLSLLPESDFLTLNLSSPSRIYPRFLSPLPFHSTFRSRPRRRWYIVLTAPKKRGNNCSLHRLHDPPR